MPNVKSLMMFMSKREAVRQMKEMELDKPWTDDAILQRFRFCNVNRENDKQTKWLADNWRTPHADDLDFWFAAMVFRLVNWNETTEQLGYPVPWLRKRFVTVLQGRKALGQKVFSGAYIISTNGALGDKAAYLAGVLSSTWLQRTLMRPAKGQTLMEWYSRLLGCTGVGSFIAGQVIADAKYVGPLQAAPDWWTFAVPGPGSRRGLNRVLARPVDAPWSFTAWQAAFQPVAAQVRGLWQRQYSEDIHYQDIQNCLCEYDKYERVRLGEGRPRATYNGGEQ